MYVYKVCDDSLRSPSHAQLSRFDSDSMMIAVNFPAPVLNLTESGATNESISAKWNRPSGKVIRYYFACSNGTADPSSPIAQGGSNMASCLGLSTAGANYTFTVTSQARVAKSAESTITITALPEAVTLKEEPNMVSPTYVTASWTMPNGIVEYYEVSCSNGTASPAQVNPSDDLIASCTGLSTPGDDYSISVTSVSYGKRSAASTTTMSALPGTPFGFSIVSSQREINLVWAYQGVAERFFIRVTPDHGRAVFNGNFTHPGADITDLIPGIIYDIDILTVSGDRTSEPMSQLVRTLPDKPSPVRNPQAEAEDKNTITLTYERPLEPNGDITSYMISYFGTRDGNPSHEFSDVYGAVLTVTYDDLYPGFSYIFSVVAVNDGGYESDQASTTPVETPQEGLTTTVKAISETNNPTSTQSTESSSPNIVSKGAQIGLIVVVVALLLYAVAITFLHIQLRRKVPTRTKENEPDPYRDLQPIPEADTTYQEMDITWTASSKRPGERRLPSPNLIYENQNVAQFANKIKEQADYEDVLTPN